MRILLYTTLGCHLCEQAEEILHSVSHSHNISVQLIEIGDDDALVAEYGIRIPVLKFPDESELGWPFTEADVETLIMSKINH